jgi:competence protein ComEA
MPPSAWARSAGELPPSLPRPATTLERLRSSAWTSLVLRAAAFVVVLLILAAIGRLSRSAPVAVTPEIADAGDPGPPKPPIALAPAPLVDAAPPPAPASAAPASHARATPDDPVYLNHAGAEELRRLPGVGTKRADAILALRARIGRFQRLEELLRVKGVGRAMVRKWRPLVRLESPPPPRPEESDAG